MTEAITLSDPCDLDSYADRIRKLLLVGLKADVSPLDPVAEQHTLIALSLLSQAISHLELASLAQARGIAEGPR